VPIITTTMLLHYDPQTFVITTSAPQPKDDAPAMPLVPALAGLAAAGLAPLVVEALAAVSRRRR
jgi:hypothetical protein